MKALLVLALVVAPLAAPLAAGSDPCALGAGGRVAQGRYYVEHRANDDVWVYEETNGVPSLQRGGRSDFGDRDRCVDDPLVVPDRIVL